MWELVQETVNYIKNKTNFSPEYGVILGSGLGSFTDDISIEFTLPYNEIPNFPVSTVQGHKGALVFGTIGDKKVMAMQGRFHFYEGYHMKQVTFPVRVMKYLGVTKLIVSNASGGVNSDYEVGSVVIIKDHVNMFPEHPLRGKNDERFGPRFLNMNEAYNKSMIKKAKEIAVENNITVHDGGYLGLQGPTFETFILPGETNMQMSYTYSADRTDATVGNRSLRLSGFIANAISGSNTGLGSYGKFNNQTNLVANNIIDTVGPTSASSGARTIEIKGTSSGVINSQGYYVLVHTMINVSNNTGLTGSLKLKNFVFRTSRSVGGSLTQPAIGPVS
jgi:purine-nucleoside phosphorylase